MPEAREIQQRGSVSNATPVGEDVDFSALGAEAVATHFRVSLDTGFSHEDAAERLATDGPNELEKVPKPTFLMLFLMQLTGFIIILLMVAAAGSIVVNATGPNRNDILSYTTGKAIFILVMINAGIAAWSERQAGDALEALASLSQASVEVVRDGTSQQVETRCIVKGDVVVLGTGDVVPADMRITSAEDMKVSEMALTGEPEDVSKKTKMKPMSEGEPEKLTPDNMVFSGCNVTNGKCVGIVTATGMGTRMGRIAELMQGDKTVKKKCYCLPDTSDSLTPMQVNVEKLGERLGIMAIGVCVVVFICGIGLQTPDPNNPEDTSMVSTVVYMILIAVTLAVAAIPEGIPLCVTISLSLGCSSMAKKNVLIRKIAAVETLGSASVICSDKTGTLTEGKMTMVKMWSSQVHYDVHGKGFDPTVGNIVRQETSVDASQDVGVKSALLAGVLCSNTTLSQVKDEETSELKWVPKGNSSEAPIVVAARKVGVDEALAAAYPRVLEIPFSSSRKMMLTVSKLNGKGVLCPDGMRLPSDAQFLTVCKGAPNFILDCCTEVLTENGSSAALTAELKASILNVVDDYSSQALRVLAIAARPLSTIPFDPEDDDVSTDKKFDLLQGGLTLLGLVASIDPDRDGVADAVVTARGAGIRVVMITGDYLKTAVAIARNVKILQSTDHEEESAVDCKSLRPDGKYVADADIDSMTAMVRVFARAKPEDKLEIVKSLQRQGLVSAMTGDGVNDAPALNQADIGVAMGIQGTEVAKGAADMILTDDNFVSIVAAVEKGRAIYSGIQKFVAFIMSVHIAEVVQIFVCVVAGIPVMRTPLQILFLILVTDLPPSIALGMEPGEKTLLQEQPRPKTQPIVLGWMWTSICMNGFLLAAIIFVIYVIALLHYCDGQILNDDLFGIPDFEEKLMKARSVAFISLVYCENVRAYTSRSFNQPFWRNFFGNAQMQKAVLVAQLCLYVAVLPPAFAENVLGLTGLKIGAWGWLVALAGPVATAVLCELCKTITHHQMTSYQNKLKKLRESGMNQPTPASIGGAEAAVDVIDSALDTVVRVVSGGELVKPVSENGVMSGNELVDTVVRVVSGGELVKTVSETLGSRQYTSI